MDCFINAPHSHSAICSSGAEERLLLGEMVVQLGQEVKEVADRQDALVVEGERRKTSETLLLFIVNVLPVLIATQNIIIPHCT